MAAIYSNGGNRWNILGFNFTKRDALSSVYKISMVGMPQILIFLCPLLLEHRYCIWGEPCIYNFNGVFILIL
jgi:hypothetical protein